MFLNLTLTYAKEHMMRTKANRVHRVVSVFIAAAGCTALSAATVDGQLVNYNTSENYANNSANYDASRIGGDDSIPGSGAAASVSGGGGTIGYTAYNYQISQSEINVSGGTIFTPAPNGVQGDEAGSNSSVNIYFTVSVPTNFVGTFQVAADRPFGGVVASGLENPTYSPSGGNVNVSPSYSSFEGVSSTAVTGQLQPGVTYEVNCYAGGEAGYDNGEFTGGILPNASYSADVKLSAVPASGSFVEVTASSTVSNATSITVGGNGGLNDNEAPPGNVTFGFNQPTSATLGVAYNPHLAGTDFSAGTGLNGVVAATPSFALPDGAFTEAWDVSDSSSTGFPLTLTFDIDPSELPAGIDPSDLAIYHYVDGQWVLPPDEIVTTYPEYSGLDPTITLTVNSLSPFALGEVPVPEPASLGLLTAAGVVLFRRRSRAL